MADRREPRDAYVRRLQSSHLRAREIARYIDLPPALAGKTILDIGSGTSTISMDLAASGARVVSMDIRFRDAGELKRSSGEYFQGFRAGLDDPVLRQRNPLLPYVYEHDVQDAQRFFDDFAGGARGRYVAGDLWRLPFREGAFDAVFSIRCLADHFADPDLFLEAVREALRVGKPGSSLQISPWQDDYLSLGRGLRPGSSAPQQERAIATLAAAGIACTVETAAKSDVRYLRVLKPSA